MSLFVARRYRLVHGAGDASNGLNAFDRALISAGVDHCNLVKVSSILPPNAQTGDLSELSAGGVLFAAFATVTSDVTGELIAASVAVGKPRDPRRAGVIMEGHFRSLGAKDAEQIVRQMTRQAMDDRNLELDAIESCSVEWKVHKIGAVFAAVLLW